MIQNSGMKMPMMNITQCPRRSVLIPRKMNRRIQMIAQTPPKNHPMSASPLLRCGEYTAGR
jgi:hypothetical protein